MMGRLPALPSDRFGVSDRATSAVVPNILKDMEMINETHTSLVIDKS